MKKASFLSASLLAILGMTMPAIASEPVTLSFTRTGTTADGVTVTVGGVESATATVTGLSHSLKAVSNTAIICPDVNGNSSPTIEMGISISGLPTDFKFNTVSLHIHALNAGGGYQDPNDGKGRHFNVEVGVNDQEFALYENIDIAAGVTDAHKEWEAEAESDVTATNPMSLNLTITKGAGENLGCFFGLESITLSYNDGEDPNPNPNPNPGPVDPVDPTDAKVYTIKWKNNTNDYMTEQADGTIAVGPYSVANKVFWQFIPTEKENCYYIRNTATGNYIGSCNMEPSSTSRVKMTTTPVEYYVHISTSTSGENVGCYWLSSTDCPVYNTESATTRALNKDGASSYIITWTAATGNKGSYWTLTETEDLYEVKPFTSSNQIGVSQANYHIMNHAGEAYDASGAWVEYNTTSKSQQWYFVGTSNAEGGYQIVNAVSNEALNSGKKYTVGATLGSAPYHFTDADGNVLALNGVSDFTFVAARSTFALDNQIYKMPCGSVGTVYIRNVTIGDDYRYPMNTYGNKRVTKPNAQLPSNKYVMLTRDAAVLTPGEEYAITIGLNRTLGDYKLYLYFDWNRDGCFDAVQEITSDTKDLEATFTVPADAVVGKTRARIRVTDNGMSAADDDTHGEVLDLILNVNNDLGEGIAPIVKVNDPNRGTATLANNKATANVRGNSTFLYWNEGVRIISVEPEIDALASTRQKIYTAFFAPNTQEMDGIDQVTLNTVNSAAQIVFDGSVISVKADSEVLAIVVFATNGSKVAGAKAESLQVSGVVPGIYIVKAITANGTATAKIKIN